MWECHEKNAARLNRFAEISQLYSRGGGESTEAKKLLNFSTSLVQVNWLAIAASDWLAGGSLKRQWQ